ncbi:MAG: hypothetical protein IH629_03770, partial [Thermoleophilia bacterium]|nr:hypothetical protein [Thermoleophilia bacterium]
MSDSANTQDKKTRRRLFQVIPTGTLQELRERVLQRISWFIIISGLLLLAISVPDYLAAQDYAGLGVDLVGFGTLLVLTIFQKKVPFRVRAIALVTVTLSQGMVDLGAAGLLGDSRIWFLFTSIFTTALLGFQAGLIANALTIGSSLVTAALILTGNDTLSIPVYQTLSQDSALWLDLMPIYIMASLFMTFTIGTIVRGMEKGRDDLEIAYT